MTNVGTVRFKKKDEGPQGVLRQQR